MKKLKLNPFETRHLVGILFVLLIGVRERIIAIIAL